MKSYSISFMMIWKNKQLIFYLDMLISLEWLNQDWKLQLFKNHLVKFNMKRILKRCSNTFASNSKLNLKSKVRNCFKNSCSLRKISFTSKFNKKILILEELQQRRILKKYLRTFKSNHLTFIKNCTKRMWLKLKTGLNNICLSKKTKKDYLMIKLKKVI